MASKRAREDEEVSHDDSNSDDVFKKTMESLTKQANDLSILCGVEVGIVVHKSNESNAVLWPSPEVVDNVMQKFLDLPELERERKMVNHEKYLEGRIDEEMQKLLKSRKKKELLEAKIIMNQIMRKEKSYEDLDLDQLNKLKSLADDMLEKLHNELSTHEEP